MAGRDVIPLWTFCARFGNVEGRDPEHQANAKLHRILPTANRRARHSDEAADPSF